jgi:hypothetical protein
MYVTICKSLKVLGNNYEFVEFFIWSIKGHLSFIINTYKSYYIIVSLQGNLNALFYEVIYYKIFKSFVFILFYSK